MYKYLLFFIVFLLISNWIRIYLFIFNTFRSVNKKKNKKLAVKNENLIKKYRDRFRLDIKIYEVDSEKIYGGMATFKPIKPKIILSSGVFKYLNEDEYDYIICHEIAHYIYSHVLKNILIWILIMFLGIYAIYYFNPSFLLVIFLSTILSFLFIQNERLFEFKADKFAEKNINDSNGMITSNKKMKERNNNLIYKNKILQFLLTPHLTYDQRVKMAKSCVNK